MRPRLVVLLLLSGACGGNPEPRSHFVIPLPPPPCIGNDTVYSPVAADTLRGLYAASPTSIELAPAGLRGTAMVHLLIDALGQVEKDSIKIKGQARPDSLGLAQALSHYRFTPARLGACSVRSWFDIKFSH